MVRQNKALFNKPKRDFKPKKNNNTYNCHINPAKKDRYDVSIALSNPYLL